MTKKTQAWPVRGLMLDPARQTERHDFYFQLLPKLAAWGYNTLWWHFMDDEGFALKLKCHPELATPFALSRAETAKLVAAAGKLGIDMVPEVECLGHTRSLTGRPEYAHLFDGNPLGHNAICPSHPDTLPLLESILTEVAGLFPAPHLHVGLDESNLGNCPRCAKRLRGKPAWWVFAEHCKAIHRIVTGLGKRMVMWADSVEKHPELLDELPKDIILAHWHYSNIPEERFEASLAKGFEIICVPRVGGNFLQPEAEALENVRGMAALAGKLAARGSLGMVASWWESNRNIRDTHVPAVAYAGKVMAPGVAGGLAFAEFAPGFFKEYFGAAAGKAATALCQIQELQPARTGIKPLFPFSLAQLPVCLAAAETPGFAEKVAAAAAAAGVLAETMPRVRQNAEAFAALALAAEVTAQAFRNAGKLKDAWLFYLKAANALEMKAEKPAVAELLGQAAAVVGGLGDELAGLRRRLEKEWDRTRHAKDHKKDGSSSLVRQRGCRGVLPTVLHAEQFLKALRKSIVRSTRDFLKTGEFPGGISFPWSVGQTLP